MGKQKINWSLYNKALINRGQVTLWFPTDISKSWYAKSSGKQGRQCIYSDMAIETLNVLRFRFHLGLRTTQGFAKSLAEMMGTNMAIPNYTTISRRLKKLYPKIQKKVSSEKNLHIIIDSTGLKVYGEGEWKVRQHGYSKRRTWKKLHLGVDESNSQIHSVVLSDNSFTDSELLGDLIKGSDNKISQISAELGRMAGHPAKPPFPPIVRY